MARSPQALIQPRVLRALRVASGYETDEVAAKLQTETEKVEAWETGEKPLSMSQLRRLAVVFKRPISDFFLEAPIPLQPLPHDFRRTGGKGLKNYSPRLRFELRSAERRRRFAIELAEGIGSPFEVFAFRRRLALSDDPEIAGGRLREFLRVSIAEQNSWREDRRGYNGWRGKIEASGVLVFQTTSVETSEMLGFALAFEQTPVIGVNRRLRPHGRTFTMVHEFVHLLLGESAICDIDEEALRPPAEQAVEVFCNRVAGAALVPMPELRERLPVNDAGPVWSDDALKELSKTFSVSEEVILRRLLIGRLTTDAFYRAKRAEYAVRYARLAEEQKLKQTEMKRDTPREAVGNLGAGFARLVLAGYEADAINLMDASRILGVKAAKVARVGELVR